MATADQSEGLILWLVDPEALAEFLLKDLVQGKFFIKDLSNKKFGVLRFKSSTQNWRTETLFSRINKDF